MNAESKAKKLKKGDLVKVIAKTKVGDGEKKELFPIGTICKVVEVCKSDDSSHGFYYGILPMDEENTSSNCPYYYLREELELGELKWIPTK